MGEKQYLVPQNALYFLKKRAKRNKNFKLQAIMFSFLFVLFLLCLILNLSDIFSSLITNSASLFSSKKLECPSYNVYAVSITDFDNEIQANEAAIQVENQGGAGVVYHSAEYFVLTSCYPTLSYAQEISENLKALGYNSKIVCLNVQEILVNYKGKNSNLFLNAFHIYKNCYNQLYELSLRLDKNEIDYIEVNSNLMLKIKQVEALKSEIEKLNSENDKVLKDYSLSFLAELESILNSGIESVDFDNNYTANLKQILIKIVVLNQQFVSQIKSIK